MQEGLVHDHERDGRAWKTEWHAIPEATMLAGRAAGGLRLEVANPATGGAVGHVLTASVADVDTALRLAEPWAATADVRAQVLRRAADLYEANFGPIFALLAREAGKTLADAVAELREANVHLRAVLIPLIVGVPAAKYLGALNEIGRAHV